MDTPLVVLLTAPLRRTVARAERLAREPCLRHLGELEHAGWVELRRGGILRGFLPSAAEDGFVLVRPRLSAREPAFLTPASTRSPCGFHADIRCATWVVRLLWLLT